MPRQFHCMMMMLVCVALISCVATPRLVEDPLGDVPEDFTIDLTILSQPAERRAPWPMEAHLRPARIVLFADGSLHHGIDPRLGANWLPGLTRRLNREQVVGIWSLTNALSLADIDRGEPVPNFALINAEPGEVKYLAAVTAFDERWAFIRSAPLTGELDQSLVILIRTLAELAWASDMPEEEADLPPHRYDFGPDPYDRYRR